MRGCDRSRTRPYYLCFYRDLSLFLEASISSWTACSSFARPGFIIAETSDLFDMRTDHCAALWAIFACPLSGSGMGVYLPAGVKDPGRSFKSGGL